jgi:hypothetical protein
MNNYSKKLSELILDLKNILEEFGDMPVAVSPPDSDIMSTAVDYEILSYNWEEPCLFPLEKYTLTNHCKKWGIISRNKEHLGSSVYLSLTCDSPDLIVGGDSIEGQVLPKTSFNIKDKEMDDKVLDEIDNLRDQFEKIISN